MDRNENSQFWETDAAIYEIRRCTLSGPLIKNLPAMRNVDGVEGWVDLHLRPVHAGKIDIAKEAIILTRAGSGYAVCIEGSHFVRPTHEALESGIWQVGDWLITVSGIAIEQVQAGDLLTQDRNAKQRAERSFH
ncbi:MAG TPA: hypothetical protein VFA09_20325 [Ktedonobacteraceae bacterium]|nr:hypothetical protein [Ktedonobacteraceae bacterium]